MLNKKQIQRFAYQTSKEFNYAQANNQELLESYTIMEMEPQTINQRYQDAFDTLLNLVLSSMDAEQVVTLKIKPPGVQKLVMDYLREAVQVHDPSAEFLKYQGDEEIDQLMNHIEAYNHQETGADAFHVQLDTQR